jgi:hypothetical protein
LSLAGRPAKDTVKVRVSVPRQTKGRMNLIAPQRRSEYLLPAINASLDNADYFRKHPSAFLQLTGSSGNAETQQRNGEWRICELCKGRKTKLYSKAPVRAVTKARAEFYVFPYEIEMERKGKINRRFCSHECTKIALKRKRVTILCQYRGKDGTDKPHSFKVKLYRCQCPEPKRFLPHFCPTAKFCSGKHKGKWYAANTILGFHTADARKTAASKRDTRRPLYCQSCGEELRSNRFPNGFPFYYWDPLHPEHHKKFCPKCNKARRIKQLKSKKQREKNRKQARKQAQPRDPKTGRWKKKKKAEKKKSAGEKSLG